jgi:glycosyltransferase involved in cell wall biosynthesis
MKVLLSSNVTHYQYAAEALNQISLLDSYHTTIAPIDNDLFIFDFLPQRLREKFKARNIEGVPKSKIVRHLFPELLQIIFKKIPTEYFNLIGGTPNYLFDYLVSKNLHNIDVLHFVSGIGVLSAEKAKKSGILTICDERMEHPEYQHSVLVREHEKFGVPYRHDVNFLQKTAIDGYKNSDFLIVGSNYTKSTYLDRGFKDEQVFTIPYGYDPKFFYPPLHYIEEDKLKIIYVGQLIPRKGFIYLMEALKKFSRHKNLEVSFVGEDPYGLYEKYIAKFNLVGICKYFGSVSKNQLAQLLRNSSVCILPSLADSQPLSCLEAIGCGCPVIVTEKMGTSEIIRNGHDGIIVRAGNTKDLKDVISDLLHNRDILCKLRRNLTKTASNYTWHDYERRLQAFYKNKII